MTKSSRRPYGQGHIEAAGKNKWVVTATHGRRADGAPRRKKRTVYGSRADAEQELLKLRIELGAKPNIGDAMTLNEYFYAIFIPSREKLLRKRTIESYIDVYKNHIEESLGKWPADQIRRPDVQRWVTSLPTAATAEKAYRHLRLVLRAMWDDELLDEKPLDRRIKLPRKTKIPNNVWTPDELLEAMERLKGHQFEGIVLAMAGGGLRREEALGLDLPSDLEFTDVVGMDGKPAMVCRAIIHSSWAIGDDQQEETKTYRVRPVTIGDPFATRLQEILRDGRPKLLMGVRSARPLQPTSVSSRWAKLFEKGPLDGMRYVQLRTLRHCHETISAQAGIGDAVNSSVHGHSAQVMYSHYLALGSDAADTVAEAVRLRLAR